MTRIKLSAALVLISIVHVGCSQSGSVPKPDMSKVTGTVTLDGAPLAKGVIVADPASAGGLPAQGTIEAGAFEFEATPGEKVVRISAVATTGKKDEYGEEITMEAIPAQYNANSELKQSVAAGSESTWTIELKSK
ncbi:MAG: hypothetical protein ACK5Q5_00040 [Planctomycetaceae bacterium]